VRCSQDPHPHAELKPAPKIGNNILDFIGNTPLVRLNSIPASEGIECEMLAKCEYFNAGGSVKDRIGKRMILDAEASGRIKKGDVLIEPTSGQTRINNERKYAGTWSRDREKKLEKERKD
jgi:cystathionine beta-synthase